MVPLTSLWVPILLSAVVMFALSSIIHMVLKYHATDYTPVPQEDRVMDALRPFNIPPGDYVAPHAGSSAQMKSPEYVEKLNRGPVFTMTVLPNGPFKMGSRLVQWFLFGVLVSVFAAYVAGRALGPGADYMTVFRIAGTVSFVGYSLSGWAESIWYSRKWSTTFKNSFDGLIYGLFTGGVFGWLWP